jgi:predicted nuclease with TOPRIM domain
MSVEERLDQFDQDLQRTKARLRELKQVQEEMLDVLGITVEGQQRLATRVERSEEDFAAIRETIRDITVKHREIDDKLNALIDVVDGFIRGKQ